jgi:hypothetical protein
LFDHADGVFIFTQKAQKFTERVIRRLGWDVKYDGVARNLVAASYGFYKIFLVKKH